MSLADWIVLFGTLGFIVLYGSWKTRRNRNIKDYLLGNNEMKWATIGLSVMATQASAITFLSTPGQAFESGMGFVQFYFGLPLAMVILCVTFIPMYYKLKVYTAYEFLENRFDLKTRLLTAFLFLLQRGLAAGITIYAPAIILSSILGWDLTLTNILVGVLVIIYTVSGGTRAVSLTQKWQMGIIMLGMFIAFFLLISYIREHVSFGNAVKIAGLMGKMEVVNFKFDINERYTFWSGITGGLFLMLAYFGTDQSQVQRYISGQSVAESRLGLLFNGMLKVPMQFFILFTGVLVFVFYQYEKPPVFFNEPARQEALAGPYGTELQLIEDQYDEIFAEKQSSINELVNRLESGEETAIRDEQTKLLGLVDQEKTVRAAYKDVLKKDDPEMETKDLDYVFITFIMNYLPVGIVGLLLAVIFSAAMSSTAGELNALASTTTVDFYKRLRKKELSERHYLIASRSFTVFWGIMAIIFAISAQLLDNLIEAVNILGSIFYGTILGIFLVAFYVKYVKANMVFIAALLSELAVIILFKTSDIGFLWYNFIGCMLVIMTSLLLQFMMNSMASRGTQ